MIKQSDQESLLIYFIAFMELSKELEKQIGDDVAFVCDKTIESTKAKLSKLTLQQKSQLSAFAKESLNDLTDDVMWQLSGGVYNN